MTEIPIQSAVELATALRAGEVTAADTAAACLDAITTREDELRAWARLDPEVALAQARALDRLPADQRGPLHGVPVGVKDIIDTVDQPTGYGSPIYDGFQPVKDADCVARLREAGAVIIGKTVTTEFAGFTPGPTTNPLDATRTPGGSSSGSAAAVGAGTVPLALGTQTAGSVVRPASFCGIYGVKPTFDGVPTPGVRPFSSSLDTVGLFARDVPGAALGLAVLTGQHPAALPTPPDPLRIGFARTYEWADIPDTTRIRLEGAADRLAEDADVIEVDLPGEFEGLVEAQITVMQAEASRALAAERRDHSDQLSVGLLAGLRVGDRRAWAYEAALAHVSRCRQQLPEVFSRVDVLFAPSVLGEAPPLEEGTGDPLLCRGWTALGTPAVAVPALTGDHGLPLGVQVIGPHGADLPTLAAAGRIAELLSEAPA